MFVYESESGLSALVKCEVVFTAYDEDNKPTAGRVVLHVSDTLMCFGRDRLQVYLAAISAPEPILVLPEHNQLICCNIHSMAASLMLCARLGVVDNADMLGFAEFSEFIKGMLGEQNAFATNPDIHRSFVVEMGQRYAKQLLDGVRGIGQYDVLVKLIRLAFCPNYRNIDETTRLFLAQHHLPEALLESVTNLRLLCNGEMFDLLPAVSVRQKYQFVASVRDDIMRTCIDAMLRQFSWLADYYKFIIIIGLLMFRQQDKLLLPLVDVSDSVICALHNPNRFTTPSVWSGAGFWSSALNHTLAETFQWMGMIKANGEHDLPRLEKMMQAFDSPMMQRYAMSIRPQPAPDMPSQQNVSQMNIKR